MVKTDLGDALASVDAQLFDESEQAMGGSHHFELTKQRQLPFSFTVVPPENSRRNTFLVRVRGTDRSGGQVEAKAAVAFVPRKTLELELWLRRACTGVSCPATQVCTGISQADARCTPVSATPVREVEEEMATDGGASAGNAADAPSDAGSPTMLSEAGQVAQTTPLDGQVQSSPDAASTPDAKVSLDASNTQDGSMSVPDASEAGGPVDATVPDAGPRTAIAIFEAQCRKDLKQESEGNALVEGRLLILDYPCGKVEGTEMTVILNLHGTVNEVTKRGYVRDHFSAYTLLNEANLIVVTPIAPNSQWDSAQDRTYLLQLIEWVYTKFAKAKIRSLWIAAHTSGSVYATLGTLPFACEESLRGRVRGVIGMSQGSAMITPCRDRLSFIAARGSTETSKALDQTAWASLHGCDATQRGPEVVGGNERRYWTNCSSGHVHEDFVMLGSSSIDPMDAEGVRKIVDIIKASEP